MKADIFDFPIEQISVLNDTEKSLLAILVELLRDREAVLISKTDLAAQIGVCSMTIFRLLKVLEYWKYIKKQPDQEGLKISWGSKKKHNTAK